MTAWKIEPSTVKTVLTGVVKDATALEGAVDAKKFTELSSAILAGGSGLMGSVPEALNDLLTDQSTKLKLINAHIAAGIKGVTNATIAYHNAQVHMADHATTQAKLQLIQATMFTEAHAGDAQPRAGRRTNGGMMAE